MKKMFKKPPQHGNHFVADAESYMYSQYQQLNEYSAPRGYNLHTLVSLFSS